MVNQQTLRKKLASTHNIKHITEAIELVASVKLQKLLQKMERFRLYAGKLQEMVENLAQVVQEQAHPFFEVRKVKNVGVIIVAGDKGLCGSYNTNLFKQADNFLERHSGIELQLTLLGQKSIDHYAKKPYKVQNKYSNYTAKIDEAHVKAWCADLVKSFENKQVDEVWMVYTRYQNILVRETAVKKILPMQKEEEATSKRTVEDSPAEYIFEPDPSELYQEIIPYALYTNILALLLESQASELSSRVVSMKAATTNAEDMITKLTLIKNKIRQFGITKEILEINAGAEGIS